MLNQIEEERRLADANRRRVDAESRKQQRTWRVDDSRKLGGYYFSYGADPSRHGEWNTYNNWYCRCSPCTEANRVKLQGYNSYLKQKGENERATATADQ